MKKPSDLKWKLVHYNDPTISLIASDYDIMQQNFDEPPQIEGNLDDSFHCRCGIGCTVRNCIGRSDRINLIHFGERILRHYGI